MSDTIYESVIAGLGQEVRDQFTEGQLHYSEETGSTNDDLLRRVRLGEAKHLDVIVADRQSHGRGRRGDRWEAASGRNLLFSVALKLSGQRTTWARLPHLAAYVLGTAVESVLTGGQKLNAKWPNDLFFDGRKLAGILVETVLVPEPFAVVGIGLNVNMRISEFPEALQHQVTSLYEIEECESNRWFLLGEIVSGFAASHPDKLTKFDEVLDWLNERNLLFGKKLRVETASGIIEGTGCGLGDDGELLVQPDRGEVISILSAERVLYC